MNRLFAFFALLFLATTTAFGAQCTVATNNGLSGLPNPILFVGQFPIAADFATIGSTFANHFSSTEEVGRGGDLFIVYPDGQLCNLTREAGFGTAAAFQGAQAIAVRDPSVHWDGDRALFSMVVGAPTQQYQVIELFWQLYELTGLAQGTPLSITKVPNQPADYNNITPVYSPDGRILFSSDRPRDGRRHLYPQHDEYESTPTNAGLYSLDPATGDLDLLDHAPSGVFTPTVDSFGRVLFTRWDHLQRDQQADEPGNPYGTFNWANEEANAAKVAAQEVFPEPRFAEPGSTVAEHRFNHFFPWQMNPDGTELETLNHIGRHELHFYFNRSFLDDNSLVEFIDEVSGRVNPNSIEHFFQIAEDPQNPGTYFGVDAPEFGTHASGVIVRLTAPPGQAPDQVPVTFVTHPDTRTVTSTPAPTHSGHYRDPRPLSDGTLLAAHTTATAEAANEGSRANPQPRYDFRIQVLAASGGHLAATTPLTAGIIRQVQYFDPDTLVSYNGPLWELQPVEVRSRPQPPVLTTPVPAPEIQIFNEEGVQLAEVQDYLRREGLALVVSRDVTRRDALDQQQPFNLSVPGGVQTTGDGGPVYDIRYLQFFQGDQIRGIGGTADPDPGRRVLAVPLHDEAVDNPPTTGPAGSVTLGVDGSMAAFVPARRALTWQLAAPDGSAVVRERYWLTFQPGEVRVCAACHGLSSADQAGEETPTNPPEALRGLLQHWKGLVGIFADGFEAGNLEAWSSNQSR